MDLNKLKEDIDRQKAESDAAVRTTVEKIVSERNSEADEALQNVAATAREIFRKDRR